MKPLYFLVITLLLLSHYSFSENINFPDLNFKQALIGAGVDTGGNGEISVTEARAVTSLDVSGKSISDLSGIKYFIHLKYLKCTDNSLTRLDVSELDNLEELLCYDNSLTSLDVSGLNSLIILYCYNNSLTSLDVSELGNLEELLCYDNSLTSLVVSGLSKLEELYCYNNFLTSLDLSGLSSLKTLWCRTNSLTSLDVSGLSSLQVLACFYNSLTTLDVSGLSKLEELYCYSNRLVSVDLRNTPNLSIFSANYNPDLQCLIVDDVNDPPQVVRTDQNPTPPYTTEPCLATFDGLEALVDGKDIHQPTATFLSATLHLAEDGCSHGSKWKAIASLKTFILTVQRVRQLGRLTPSEAALFTSNTRKLIGDIRNGNVACSGEPWNILDWFSHWFGDFYLENPAGTKDPDAFRPAAHAVQRVYPNPTSGRVNFSTPVQQIVVYNMLGQAITKAGGVDHIDMTGLDAGVYVIRLTKDHETSVHRVVKR